MFIRSLRSWSVIWKYWKKCVYELRWLRSHLAKNEYKLSNCFYLFYKEWRCFWWTSLMSYSKNKFTCSFTVVYNFVIYYFVIIVMSDIVSNFLLYVIWIICLLLPCFNRLLVKIPSAVWKSHLFQSQWVYLRLFIVG